MQLIHRTPPSRQLKILAAPMLNTHTDGKLALQVVKLQRKKHQLINKKHLKNVGPFATASRRTPPAHRCPQQRRQRQRQQRQRVTDGTAMAPWNGPNERLGLCDIHKTVCYLNKHARTCRVDVILALTQWRSQAVCVYARPTTLSFC